MSDDEDVMSACEADTHMAAAQATNAVEHDNGCPAAKDMPRGLWVCTCAPPSQRAELLTREQLHEALSELAANNYAGIAVDIRAHIAALQSQLDAAKRENDFLRAYTGNSAKACVYCGLGAEEQGKCTSGFPGCARGDDQMLCREAAVGMERDELRKEVAALTQRVEAMMAQLAKVHAHAKHGIPFYAYGDNQAACEMAALLSRITAMTTETALSQKPRNG